MKILDDKREGYKPFSYPWAYDAWKKQMQLSWLPEEINLSTDVNDWKTKLNEDEKRFLTGIFRFFTQSDLDVNDGYADGYIPFFKTKEIRMMLTAFSAMETVHIDAYAKLIETLELPNEQYVQFLKYDVTREKHEYIKNLIALKETPFILALRLGIFGAFVEGVQLFSSFAMLFNFQRFNKMKGMCQIVSWSIRDETLHIMSCMKLFRTLVAESELSFKALEEQLVEAGEYFRRSEKEFIDLVFDNVTLEGLRKQDMYDYVDYILAVRLKGLGINLIIPPNPIPWIEDMLYLREFSDFFEMRPTEYAKNTLSGDWNDCYDK